MTDREADDLLAAELAFGLLDADERPAAEQRVNDDPAFAERFRWWQARSLALLEGRDEAPSAWVWAAIERQLPANDNRRHLRRWQAATAVAAALALVFGTTLLMRPNAAPVVQASAPVPPPASTLVAVLASPDRGDIVAVDYDPAGRRLSVLPSALTVGAHDAELWVIPAGGAPVSLGLLPARRRTLRAASPQIAALLVPGSTLAISLEPRGGSKTGAPTGAVILTGKIARS
ncbi:anti-sigma factor domain-containing protein [Sphingomonas sp.]|uniref:anti-sigma factor n=1 Tax=Sphingomonas sp. TaxID=28214 RepID=UPI0035BBCA40